MNILLQPASGREAMGHFEDTISNKISLDLIGNYVSSSEIENLKKLKTSEISVWGFVSEKGGETRKEWEQLKSGDWVLFYAKRQFYYLAKVYSKVHNEKLAEKLWGYDVNEKTWEYVYFIEEGKNIEVPYNPLLLKKQNGERYKGNHIVQGAILLDAANSLSIKNYLESMEGEIIDERNINPTAKEKNDFLRKVKEPKTAAEAEREIEIISEDIKEKTAKERVLISKIIVRNSKFARLVKEKSEYICEICEAKPFIQKNGLPYAEAHHVFELSKNKLDIPKYMICVCPTCHKVIHYGNEEALRDRKNK